MTFTTIFFKEHLGERETMRERFISLLLYNIGKNKTMQEKTKQECRKANKIIQERNKTKKQKNYLQLKEVKWFANSYSGF